jgi:hypothetical protein
LADGALGFAFRAEAVPETLTEDVLKSSEIEGELLNKKQVRSSIARRLGMELAGLVTVGIGISNGLFCNSLPGLLSASHRNVPLESLPGWLSRLSSRQVTEFSVP